MRIDSSKQRARAPANLMQMYANEPDATSTANSVKKNSVTFNRWGLAPIGAAMEIDVGRGGAKRVQKAYSNLC